MASFQLADAVIVSGRGPGVVTDIIGGPVGKLYRVSFTGPELSPSIITVRLNQPWAPK